MSERNDQPSEQNVEQAPSFCVLAEDGDVLVTEAGEHIAKEEKEKR